MGMEKVKGYIEHFVYRNAENGYAVVNLITDGEELTCTGNFGSADIGDNLELEGEYTTHAIYGEQFKVTNYKITIPDDVTSMQRYLASGAIKGIGEALAAKIIKKFGEDTFRIIEDEPERLAEIKGISQRKAIDISIQMSEKREMRDAIIFLQQYGISNNLAVKIFEQYGTRIYAILKENPYQLAEDIAGIGFHTADEIAEKIGIRVDSDYRIRSGLLYALSQAAADGNSYLPRTLLVQKASELLGVEQEITDAQIDNLLMAQKLVIKGQDQVYASSFYYVEQSCAVMLHDLNVKSQDSDPGEEQRLRDQILELERKKDIELDELQREAVLKSISNGIVIITGGPGTGKTTTINAIIAYYAAQGLDIMLAAPTGRAAKRMTEATGYEARTIHRLLEVNGGMSDDNDRGLVRFEKNAENPLEADAIIIDEMSMVDMHLFHALLKAIVPGMHLILVGDSSQLPSVGPGQVLHDLIASGKFSTIVLQKIFRQAEESDIVMNAHRIHRGEPIKMDNKSKDFFFLERNNSDVIYDIQVLTPMKKGPLGAETLNTILQSYLNPASDDKKEHTYGDKLFRVGDKVMQIKNNYQAEWEVEGKFGVVIDHGMGIFNGDMGIIVEINDHAQELVVEYDEHRKVRYSYTMLDDLELAYAITIHKSQGSEYPAVVMPLLGGPRMLLNRNLLYTAVTRAKGSVVILGSRDTVNTMIQNEEQLHRYTGLTDRIADIYTLD